MRRNVRFAYLRAPWLTDDVANRVDGGRLAPSDPGEASWAMKRRRTPMLAEQTLSTADRPAAPPAKEFVMRIVVLGGGVVGVTTAYQLQRDGHEVVVVERNREVAAEASFGNAGMIAPGHSFVWSSPRAPLILAKSLMLKDQALRFKLSADPRLYAWTWGFLKECTPAKARRNTLIKHRLAAYSQTVLDSVVAAEAIDYDRNLRGILYLHRSQRALIAGVEHMKLLEVGRADHQGA